MNDISPIPAPSKGTLLIVDDIADNVMLLFRFLNRAGFKVLVAQDGEQAIQITHQARPDLLLLDIMMPGLDGYEVCQHLKSQEDTQDIPIIFMSALTDTQDKLKGFKLGAADYITKPVERAEVLARVTVHVRLRQLQCELQEKNRQLQEEVATRKIAEAAMQKISGELSERNRELQKEIEERMQVQQALQKANQELERLANLDGLTQIANRRRFDEYFAQEWLRMSRERLPLALILCDIDYFKAYNDTYGHQAGDDCLRGIAQVLTRAARRPADLVARYGGEEFTVVLPHTAEEGALQVARQIQQELGVLRIEHKQSTVAPYVTLSLGIACLVPHAASSPEAFLATADKALYRAKHQGRNQVVLLQPENGAASADDSA